MKGQANEAKGKVKEAAGRVTGNDRLKASGRADVQRERHSPPSAMPARRSRASRKRSPASV